ncbi:MAG: sugar ABC transporter ATP-binding protein [Halanaerobiales bacterium]|nr:sugar ABC transporter ATP-binding protein [Halanaerobiales bacterium]
MGTKKNNSLLEIRGVTKTFGGVVKALNDVNITIEKNEIVGVVGENGAGKSTLMKILVGVFPPDQGELYYAGEKIPFPNSPSEAAKRGISIVYQEKGVIPQLQVYQFLLLGREYLFNSYNLQIEEMKASAVQILRELQIDCSVESFMYELSLSTQKMLEIARAILSIRLEQGDNNVNSIIILDEPTAPLCIEETRKLFDYLLKMKEKANASFVFVSHIIPEIMEFTNTVHVLRDGNVVGHYNMAEHDLTEEELFKAIAGKESSTYIDKPVSRNKVTGEIVLDVDNLKKNGCYYDVNFELYRGECIGIFGAAGSGKSKLLNSIAGQIDFDQGNLIVNGNKLLSGEPPHTRLKKGIGYFSGDNNKELFLNWSIAKNISILNMDKITDNIINIIDFKKEKKLAKNISDSLNIKAPDVMTDCYSLSGGNKQKVSVGKWLENSPDIILLEDPTIGVDVGARRDIYEAIYKMNDIGISMILVSDDPKEYSALCDRVVFMTNGKIDKVLNREEFEEVIR